MSMLSQNQWVSFIVKKQVRDFSSLISANFSFSIKKFWERGNYQITKTNTSNIRQVEAKTKNDQVTNFEHLVTCPFKLKKKNKKSFFVKKSSN